MIEPMPVNVVFGDDLSPLPADRLVQQYQFYGVPRRGDFVSVDWPTVVGMRVGVVYRVDWGTDGVPTIFLR